MESKSNENVDSFSEKIAQLSLTEAGFENKGTHVEKILSILFAFLNNGPASKWELSTVKYRDKEKKGFTTFSWVLVHKLISEMQKFGLVRKYGKSDTSTKNHTRGKKHIVDLYYPTITGVIFALLSDKKIYTLYSDKDIDFSAYFDKGINRDDILPLLDIVWHVQYLSSEGGKEIRMLLMEKTVREHSFMAIIETILKNVVSYTMAVMEKTMSYSVDSKNIIENELLKVAALRSALSSIKNRRVRQYLASALIKQIVMLDFSIRVAKWLHNDLGGLTTDMKKLKHRTKMETEQIFLKLMTISDIGAASFIIEPALRSARKVTKKFPVNGEVNENNKSEKESQSGDSYLSDLWKYQEEDKNKND